MKAIAPILEQTAGKIRFRVDEVKRADKRLPVEAAKTQLAQSLESQLLAFSHEEAFSVIAGEGIHPLAHAVHAAFSEHRPLLLTPDIIWLTLAQGFAQHINNHSEALRSQFVRHQGKQTLAVETSQIPSQLQHWSDTIQQWALHIRDQVGADLYRLLECNFSTTTPITRTASQVVMMDAFQQYFDYVVYCICGIPEITLLGTVADWQSIYDRVKAMAEYDLTWWTDRVLPICEALIATAQGQPSLQFWQAIYKPQAVYGGEVITGWLALLFPYLQHYITHAPTLRNPILEIEPDQLTVDNGISPKSLPTGLSQAPFTLTAPDGKYALELVAGFIGVQQDPTQGTLKPEIGWAVRERDDRFAKLLDQVQQQHETRPPIEWSSFVADGIVKHHIQLLERFNGATLYPNSGHAWKIADLDACRTYTLAGKHPFKYCYANHLIELDDGRCIAYVSDYRTSKLWIVLGQPTEHCDPRLPDYVEYGLKDIKIIAQDIPHLFERIFKAQGQYYFSQPGFVPLPFKQ